MAAAMFLSGHHNDNNNNNNNNHNNNNNNKLKAFSEKNVFKCTFFNSQCLYSFKGYCIPYCCSSMGEDTVTETRTFFGNNKVERRA